MLWCAALVALVGYAAWLLLGEADGAAATSGVGADVERQDGRVAGTAAAAAVPSGRSAGATDKVQAFEALKARAKAGDAVAQRLLAQAYQACTYVNADRERVVRMFERSLAGMKDAAQAQVHKHLAAVRLADCDAVDGGASAPMEIAKAWYAQAAQNGDLAARAMDDALSRRQRDTATNVEFLEEVSASGDPAAVYAFGQVLSPTAFAGAGQPYEALTAGPMAGYAWIVAACRMGYDCGPESEHVVNMCLLVNRCPGQGFEEYLRSELKSDEERQELDRRVEAVLGLVEGR